MNVIKGKLLSFLFYLNVFKGCPTEVFVCVCGCSLHRGTVLLAYTPTFGGLSLDPMRGNLVMGVKFGVKV